MKALDFLRHWVKDHENIPVGGILRNDAANLVGIARALVEELPLELQTAIKERDEARADVDKVRDELAAARSDLKVAQEDRAGLRENLETAEDALRSARGLVEAYLLHNPDGSLNDAIKILGNAYRQKRDTLDQVSKILEERREECVRLIQEVHETRQQRTLIARRLDEAIADRDNWKATAEARHGAFDEMQEQRDDLQRRLEIANQASNLQAEEIAKLKANPWCAPLDVVNELQRIREHVQKFSAGPYAKAGPCLPDLAARLAKQVGPDVDVLAEFLSPPEEGGALDPVRAEIRTLLDRNELLAAAEQAKAEEIPPLWEKIETLQGEIHALRSYEVHRTMERQRDSAEKAAAVIAKEHGLAVQKLQAAEERIRLLTRDREELSRQVNHGAEVRQRRAQVEELREDLRKERARVAGLMHQLDGYRSIVDAVRLLRRGRA